MHLANFSAALPLLMANTAANAATITSFNLTAIAAANGRSLLQCWQITLPITRSTTTGIAGAVTQDLGNLTSMQWTSLPPNYAGTAHPAPVVQYVIFLSGTTYITIPDSTQEVYMVGGKYGLLIASDTAAVSKMGHVSSTGRDEITGLMIPTEGGVVPSHNVIHQGPCLPIDLQY